MFCIISVRHQQYFEYLTVFKLHHSSTTIDAQWFPKWKKGTLSFFCIFFLEVGGFQKSYVIFRGGTSKYLQLVTGAGGWSGKGQKHPCVI